MGYAHYFNLDASVKEFNDELLKDIRKIVDYWSKKNILGFNSVIEIDSTSILINGETKYDMAFELNTFDTNNDEVWRYFYIMTDRSSYDQAICEIIITLKKHLKNLLSVSSDGFDIDFLRIKRIDETWLRAFERVNKTFSNDINLLMFSKKNSST